VASSADKGAALAEGFGSLPFQGRFHGFEAKGIGEVVGEGEDDGRDHYQLDRFQEDVHDY